MRRLLARGRTDHHAEADVAAARSLVEATRRRVLAGKDTGTALATAEYALQGALRRLEGLQGEDTT